jgi:hypothetical protein
MQLFLLSTPLLTLLKIRRLLPVLGTRSGNLRSKLRSTLLKGRSLSFQLPLVR